MDKAEIQTVGELYPEIEPYSNRFMQPLDDTGQQIYIEECGNPDGYPIIVLHGGPGAGCSAKDRRYFDPQKWRIILFDQRGSGRSEPFGSIVNNTTGHLCDDINDIYRELGIHKAVLFGGSWGSTLALVFAIGQPEKVSGMILRGIFLGEKEEIANFWNGSTGHYFPEAWVRFASFVPPEFRRNPAEYYYRKLMSEDQKVRRSFAYEWARYEEALIHLEPQPETATDKETSDFPYESLAIMEAHYLYKNHAFLDNKHIIKNAHKISDIPISIIQGRYDIVCPPVSAYRLGKALKAEPQFVTAGHSSSDPEIRKKLISETEAMYDKVTR